MLVKKEVINNPKIGNNAIILTLSKIITTLIALVSSMLLSRFRTLEEYGTYSQLILVINLTTSFFMLGLPNSTNYFLGRSDSKEERRHFLSVYYTMNTIMCFFIGIFLLVMLPLITNYFKNESIRNFLYILAILPWTKVIISSISNVLVVYGQTKKLTLFNILNALVVVAAILIVKLLNWSFQVYMFLYMLGEMAMTIWVYLIVIRLERPIRPSINLSTVKNIFRFSIPIGIASLVGTLTLECDKLVIGKLFSTETMAIYTNAAKELPFTIIATSLTAVLLPQMSRKLKENRTIEAVQLWKTTVELSYIFMSFVVTALIVFAPQIMTILYSEKYLPGVNVFRVYSAVLLCRITYFGMILNASGKTKFILFSSIITLITNIALDILLFNIIGMLGPAVATFISIFIALIAQLIATSKLIKIPFSSIFPWKQILIHSMINLVWGTVVLFVLKLVKVGTSNRDIICCFVCGILIIMCYVLIEKNKIIVLWKKLNSASARNEDRMQVEAEV